MKNELVKLIEERSPGAKPLFLVVRGSLAYGTNIETSDTDYAGVFIQSMDDILGGINYKEQINDDNNDIVIYELRRFIDLLGKANPTVLELLNTPDECVIYKDPVFDNILSNSNLFITKQCANSFGGYARQQVYKAKGMNKKQNWEKDKVVRKDILDFCYVIDSDKTIPWKTWNKKGKYDERFIGAINLPNARDVYTLFYDGKSSDCFSEKNESVFREYMIEQYQKNNIVVGFGYKGLVNVGEGNNLGISNQLRLSSIPKGEKPIVNIVYNKDGYSEHCKDYREYQEWLEKRNTQRWVDVKSHGQKIDGKNMMHCKRLVEMAREIAEGKGILVRRDNVQELLSIRRGEVDLQTLIDYVENEINEVYRLFFISNLPESVDKDLINSLIVKIRKEVYGL